MISINIFFDINENFEGIIKQNLKDKKIYHLNLIPTGWTNIVYEVKTNEGNYFFRFPRDEFWSRTIIKDFQFANYIYGKLDFHTIKLELFYDNQRPYSRHRKISGTPLAEKMLNLNDTAIEQVCDEISQFMFQLHHLPYHSEDIFNISTIGLNLTDFLDELLTLHVSPKDRVFWSTAKKKRKLENCLVHGDLNSSNILLDDANHVTAIIDFGFGGFGNKYDDIARIIGRCPNNFKNKFIKGYEKYSNLKLDMKLLDFTIDTWNQIDQGYINYMKNIGIYD